jgi:hypothetical protein
MGAGSVRRPGRVSCFLQFLVFGLGHDFHAGFVFVDARERAQPQSAADSHDLSARKRDDFGLLLELEHVFYRFEAARALAPAPCELGNGRLRVVGQVRQRHLDRGPLGDRSAIERRVAELIGHVLHRICTIEPMQPSTKPAGPVNAVTASISVRSAIKSMMPSPIETLSSAFPTSSAQVELLKGKSCPTGGGGLEARFQALTTTPRQSSDS